MTFGQRLRALLANRTKLGYLTNMRLKHLLLLLLALAIGPVAAQPKPPTAKPLTKIIFYTDWKAQAEHGGYYQALALGHYKRAGLDVTIRAGGPQTDNSHLLAAGAIDLAMVSNAFQAITLAHKKADVKMVMAVFQKDPQIIMAHGSGVAPPLTTWKTRAMFMDDAFRVSYYPWLKARFGFTDAQVRPYAFSLNPWRQNKQALQEGYLSSEPFTAQKSGVSAQVLVLADAGFDGYGQMVATTGKLIRTRPDVVRAFVVATQSGWQSYLNGDPAPGNALMRRDNPDMSEELMAYGRRQLIAHDIILSGDAKIFGIGAMLPQRWQKFVREMELLGVVPKHVEARSIYDMQFLVKAAPVDKR
jgi:NitT/TauT family transport system substrate-binding protein